MIDIVVMTCLRRHPEPCPRYERKLLQYKSRVEAELQDASGRESELEIKLKAKNQDGSVAEAGDQIGILNYLQECDRLGQESLKTKDLQEKVVALQVGMVVSCLPWMVLADFWPMTGIDTKQVLLGWQGVPEV